VRRVRRHVESNNIILLVVLLEFKRGVAIIAINYKQLVRANSILLCIIIKVL
jgi:hypothetical protein